MRAKRQYRVRWQRLGMGRAKVRSFETEPAALRLALKLQGRMAEAYPELSPSHPHCCGGSWDCGCGGETWAERWARESALVPPLIVGPLIDSREVGEWGHEQGCTPPLVPDELVQAFEDGGRRWPIPEPAAAVAEPDYEDIPF